MFNNYKLQSDNNTINLKDFNRLEKSIDSLSNSTNLTVTLKNEKIIMSRLNSYNSSKAYMNYIHSGHNCENTIMLQNDRKTIIIVSSAFYITHEIDTNMKQFMVRNFIFRNILSRIPSILLPKWIQDNSETVFVFFVDNFNGFSEKGTPMFDKSNRFIIQGIDNLILYREEILPFKEETSDDDINDLFEVKDETNEGEYKIEKDLDDNIIGMSPDPAGRDIYGNLIDTNLEDISNE